MTADKKTKSVYDNNDDEMEYTSALATKDLKKSKPTEVAKKPAAATFSTKQTSKYKEYDSDSDSKCVVDDSDDSDYENPKSKNNTKQRKLLNKIEDKPAGSKKTTSKTNLAANDFYEISD